MNKKSELLKLARKRQATRLAGYKCIGDYHGGAYECDLVSPYTKTAGNVDADVMVMLQDWNSDDSLRGAFSEERASLGYTPGLSTNRNLVRLLDEHFGLELNEVYGTNLFPFVKLGGTSAKIARSDLVAAAQEFALPQVRIVQPKLLICLGIDTFNALRLATGLPRVGNLDQAVANAFSVASTRVWGQAHTARLGQNNRNRGGVDRVTQDWKRMKADVKL